MSIAPSSIKVAPQRWLSLGLGFSLFLPLPAALAAPGAPNGNSENNGPSGISVPGAMIVYPQATYPLGPGDKLKISVQNHPEYDQDNVIVPPDGLIALPVFRNLNVNGKTRDQVQQVFQKRLRERMRDPHVTVSLVALRPAGSGYVFVIGDVAAPGTIDIRAGYRLDEVLARVGGVRNGRYDDTEATLSRTVNRRKREIPLDLYQAFSHPKLGANITMEAGDVLSVRIKDPGQLSVNGDVRSPGVYNIKRVPQPGANEVPFNPHLTDLLVVAGLALGSSPNTSSKGAVRATATGGGGNADVAGSASGTTGTPNAGPTDATTGAVAYTGFIMRKAQRIPLRVMDAIKFKDAAANVPLLAGDFVTIEKVPPITVTISGDVQSPNQYIFTPGIGVVQAIAQAGGVNKPLEKFNVSIHRRGNLIIPVDFKKALIGTDPGDNPVLQDQDTLQLDEPNIIKVYVSGPVGKPTNDTPLRLAPNTTIFDAIGQSGGLTPTPDLVSISIVRSSANGKTDILRIDPIALFNFDPHQNTRLQDGDTIAVANLQKRTAYVTGQVNKIGAYELKPNEGLVDLLADAGGVMPTAALTKVVVNRGGQTFTADVYNAVTYGAKLDFPIQAGDSVVVPTNEHRVLIIDAVQHQGIVPIPENKDFKVLDAIIAAGGPAPGAKTQEILLIRQPPNAKRVNMLIPYDKIKRGDLQYNIPLQDYDIISVPPGKPGVDIIGRATQAASLFGILRVFGL